MIQYPRELHVVFEKLLKNSIRPIIVGGYIRDALLNQTSKDIDVELYGISSYNRLEMLLEEFGSVNIVGKSFGICKLQLYDLEVDFSFPRLDSKVSTGHKGFNITIDSDLDFKTATSRRDFTINAIGYDIKTKEILDPFNGLQDLHQGILRAVDLNKFAEDPLRIVRAVQFSARFDFKLDNALLKLSQEMVQANILQELPQERIFEELKKVLFKAKKPSQALIILQELGAINNFSDFLSLLKDFDFIAQKKLSHKQLSKTLTALINIINGDTTQAQVLAKISKELQKVKPLLQGRDLINLGLKPSKDFSHILDKIYNKQIRGEVKNKQEAIFLVKNLL